MLHYVPDPVAIPDPVVADILFVGGDYTLLPERDLVKFTMNSSLLSVSFEFTATKLSSFHPVYFTEDVDRVRSLLAYNPDGIASHSTTMDWGSDAGPEILKHLVFWVRDGINIEIDLSELRKQANK